MLIQHIQVLICGYYDCHSLLMGVGVIYFFYIIRPDAIVTMYDLGLSHLLWAIADDQVLSSNCTHMQSSVFEDASSIPICWF